MIQVDNTRSVRKSCIKRASKSEKKTTKSFMYRAIDIYNMLPIYIKVYPLEKLIRK